MEESRTGGVHIQAGGNVGIAAGRKSIAAGGDIYGGINQHEIQNNVIQLDDQYLNKMHKDYADSLKQFVEQVNKRLQTEKVPAEKIAPIKESLNTVAKELEGVKPDEDLPPSKEYSIGAKFSSAIEGLIDISPQIAETVVSCIPILSVFSKPIGKGVETIIERYRNSKKQ
jgi:hypothetical protein